MRLAWRDFIGQLEQLYRKEPPSSVHMTLKHFTGFYSVKHSGRGPTKVLPRAVTGGQPGSAMLLIRATDGMHKNISAIVPAREIVPFQLAFDRLLRQQLVGFPKTDKASARPRSTT
jgi:hypothetical protein